ncbi:YcgL domain-containing protein [Candidatus Enterovibrio altilux]|nr:YcgL domain-containing protein [Candidatus Enterovibrio luxaltus]
MHCSIYKSNKKELTYLYINRKDDFSNVPEQLLTTFGNPEFVMVINIDKRKKLAFADITKVRDSLKVDGFYLQLPPQSDVTMQHIRVNNTKL